MEAFSKLFRSKSKNEKVVKRSASSPVKSKTEKWERSDVSFSRESKVDDLSCEIVSAREASPGNEDKILEVDHSKSTDSGTYPDDMFARTLDGWNPETCVRLLRMPSVQNYSGLKKLIAESSDEWIRDFLDMKGLVVLFESVQRLASRSSGRKMEKTILILQCISCLKAVEYSRFALNYIAGNNEYAEVFAGVLVSENSLVKKQLFEFMAALSIYSQKGHQLILDALESYKVSRKQRYRFAVLLSEMKQAEVLPHVATVLALINYIILGAPGFRFRTRIRNEFLALGLSELLDSLNQLQDEEILLQCSVFSKSKEADEEHAQSIGLKSSSSHFALFQCILDKVEDKPHSASFLIILQNLSLLDPDEKKSDYVWSTLEELTDRAVNADDLRHGFSSISKPPTKSTSIQTSLTQDDNYLSDIPNSSESQRHSDLHPESRKREEDEGSETSTGSRDSGVPVSRSQSWASHDIVEVFIQPKGKSSEKNRNSFSITPSQGPSMQPIETVSAAKVIHRSNSFASAQTFARSSSEESKSSKTYSIAESIYETESQCSVSSSPIIAETTVRKVKSASSTLRNDKNLTVSAKRKKNFSLNINLPFFNKSKKYNLNKVKTPEVRIHPPSPDLKLRKAVSCTSIREGMTSIELKRSRRKANASAFLRRDCESISEGIQDTSSRSSTDGISLRSDSSIITYSHMERPLSCTSTGSDTSHSSIGNGALQDDICRKLQRTGADINSTLSSPSPPPPPPPPPPPLPGIILDNSVASDTLSTDTAEKRLTRSWSSVSHSTNETLSIGCRPIYHTLPRPKAKMKTLNWAKIPVAHVDENSIWNEINSDSSLVELDFDKVETLFCQQQKPPKVPERRSKKGNAKKLPQSQVSLVDSKRSLSICVFVKQFKHGLDELMDLLLKCHSKEMGGEKLRTLITLLPSSEEVKHIKSYNGDTKHLGIAENFILKIGSLKNAVVHIEGMLLLEEFPMARQTLQEHVDALLETCKTLLTNEDLKHFLRLVLAAGNFINMDSYAGNAVGFRLSTLPKVLETRTNQPQTTLLHYLVEEALKKNPESLQFTNCLLKCLSRCSRMTVESMAEEINQTKKSIMKLEAAIKEGDAQLEKYYSSFIKNSKKELFALEEKVDEINYFSKKIASRYSEDESKFKLQDCLTVFYNFCVRIKIALSEIQERKRLEDLKNKKRNEFS